MAPTWQSSADSPLVEYTGGGFSALVWLPRDKSTERPLPVLIHLHGAGEAGSSVWKVLAPGQTGTPPVQLHFGSAPATLHENFVVVAPQSPTPSWNAEKVCEFAGSLLANPPAGVRLDPLRVVIAGHSNGATAAVDVAVMGIRGSSAGARFAACVPVAPGGCRRNPAELADTPTWLFHGINDVVLPVRCADKVYAALREAVGTDDETRLRYTRIEKCPPPPGHAHLDGHGTPIVAWAQAGLFEWLLACHAGAARRSSA